VTDPATDPAKRKPPPSWDVPVTIALLLGGLYTATTSFATAPNAAVSFDEYMVSAGIGHYTQTALAVGSSYATAASELLALLLAIGFSVPRLRTHRRAFWIPLVSAAISLTLALVFSAVAFFGDPAFQAYLNSSFK
jgi:Family of unknown function (DUF6264)